MIGEVETSIGIEHAAFRNLVRAIVNEDVRKVKELIEEGAPIRGCDEIGLTPLHYAAITNDGDQICTILLNHGADTQGQSLDGSTPEDLARQFSRSKVIEVLASRNIQIR